MSLKYSILGLLYYRNLHGYRLKEILEKNFGHMWTINFGQIYLNFKKMLEEKLIDAQEENRVGEKGPPRKLYSLTEQGRIAFSEWLASSSERDAAARSHFDAVCLFWFWRKRASLKNH